MATARRHLIDLSLTRYYHCVSRCVRRAYLCGEDQLTGKNYSYRKQWVIEILSKLDKVFAIDICAYAVMSNHYHLVLQVNREETYDWSKEEVVERWKQIFPLSAETHKNSKDHIELWRKNLSDISWFMRFLNESLARRCNREDECKGRFWEGRFKSQALLDEAALLTCMSYVDLNPIRAEIATTPEEYEFTSIRQRIHNYLEEQLADPSPKEKATLKIAPIVLTAFKEKGVSLSPEATKEPIPFYVEDYLQLVDWTGRAIRSDKPGRIPERLLPIFARIKMRPESWVPNVKALEENFFKAVGQPDSLKLACQHWQQNFICGVTASNSWQDAA